MAGSGGSGGGSVGGGGGFSGGGFSGGGGFRGGGFHHGSFINTTHYHGRGFRRGSGGSNGSNGSNGPDTHIFKIGFGIVAFIILFSILSITELIDSDDYYYNDYDSYYEEIFSQTYEDYENSEDYEAIKKEPLNSDWCTPIDEFITDGTSWQDFGEIGSDLKKSLNNFYSTTGIQPHVYFVDYGLYGDLYSEALDKYYELFEDEGHLLLAIATDAYDYQYELIIGDDTREILDGDALGYFNKNIENAMFAADAGDYDSIAQNLADAFNDSAEQVMTGFVYIGNYYEDESESLTTEVIDDESVTDEPTSEVVVTDEDSFEDFIEDEFGSDDTEDELDMVFDKIETAMEKVNITGVIFAVVLVGIIAVIIIFSRKRNRYEPDSYSVNKFDNYDEQFKKKDSKYDNFLN